MRKIGIIGGGPSGIFAAINVKNENNEVYLFDKNDKIGEKLRITGNGRCNITNTAYYDQFLDKILRNKNFMYSSFSKFDNYSMIDFLKSQHIDIKIEENGKVFPKSDDSREIIDMFDRLIEKRNIKFIGKSQIIKVDKLDNGKFIIKSDKDSYIFDDLIIATGGLTYPKTGSTGDGYKFAKNFGHQIVEPKASLSPLYIKDKLPIKALNISNVAIHAKGENKSYFEYGDILISNSLITGPAAMRFKARICRDKLTKVWIDFLADYSKESLDKVIVDLINESPKKNLTNSLKNLINESLLEIILERSNINKDIKSYELNKAMRHDIITMIKEFKLNLDTRENFNNAVITSGGIDVKEINPQSMESKLVKNLYFVGEVLDIDALTGGYNLQIAFSTAYAASLAIKEKI
ncbi:NAD(P)/FAD-dependent oxidoreductase [Anaerococcus tetradius]|uniref:NAD(P)/FAD-dependent oxidoreductase n=1 Tax=Anaerococcus tetradius TaxID=33036 RepID=UPI0023F0BCB0|nr:NAD(P)/FAD-dependent oxidoreductase [Anaerococcus tetradius]